MFHTFDLHLKDYRSTSKSGAGKGNLKQLSLNLSQPIETLNLQIMELMENLPPRSDILNAISKLQAKQMEAWNNLQNR